MTNGRHHRTLFNMSKRLTVFLYQVPSPSPWLVTPRRRPCPPIIMAFGFTNASFSSQLGARPEHDARRQRPSSFWSLLLLLLLLRLAGADFLLCGLKGKNTAKPANAHHTCLLHENKLLKKGSFFFFFFLHWPFSFAHFPTLNTVFQCPH